MKQIPIKERWYEMTKKAMVEELINLGCVQEKDRKYLMRQSKDYVENRIYKVAIPLKMAYLKNQSIENQ